MIPADTVRVVDTVWVAVQRDPAGFVEQATAWSTVAVALLALVALFLPWWDRRQHRRAVDGRVAITAHALTQIVGGLENELTLLRAVVKPAEDVKGFLSRLATCRDRLADLAGQAVDGSPRVARGVAYALALVAHETMLLELGVQMAGLMRHNTGDDELAQRLRSCAKGIEAALEYLHGVADKRPWQAVDRVTQAWAKEALDRIRAAEAEKAAAADRQGQPLK